MTPRVAIKLVLGLLSVVMIFHLCILLKIIPYDITWGGKLKNDTEMYVFETISIIINSFLAITMLQKGDYITKKIKNKTINIILWVFFGIFALNTAGNLFAETFIEKSFTFITACSCYFIWVILTRKN